MNNRNNRNRGMWTNHHFLISVVAIVVLLIFPMVKDLDPDLAVPFTTTMVLGLVAFFVIKGLKFSMANKKSGSPVEKKTSAIPEPGSQKSAVREPVARKAAAPRRHMPMRKSAEYPKPDPDQFIPVVSGEDHLARDKHRRIAQLDGWLKSGLIDRDEYNALLERFENDQ